jgi:hypothetical protein
MDDVASFDGGGAGDKAGEAGVFATSVIGLPAGTPLAVTTALASA